MAEKLTRVYLDEVYGPESAEKRAFVDGEEQHTERTQRMHRAYEELDRLYKSGKTKEQKLAEKATLLTALRAELRFRRPVNNATLSAFRNYYAATSEFEALLTACDGKWERFFGTLARLRKDGSFSRPNQMELGPVLSPLVAAKCPA